MRSLELLAPAKNIECGMAAISHGADAVYMGASRFSARAAAGNSVEDIKTLCDYAHQFGAKVYVTVNTIIYDNEIDDTRKLLLQLNEIGVDALLVQDMGVLKLVEELKEKNGFSIELHASTQTDNRSTDKVEYLRELGFKRAVLARELSAEEIAAIHQNVPNIELEVFVHGALCVSYSGVCYASQYCFNRSANRGACAQFCRMKFDLVDSEDHEIEHQRHLLSLRDMCQIDNLELLAESGACSFKIEGRLKDVDYVKNVVAAYSSQLDKIVKKHPRDYRRASFGNVEYTFEPNLKKTFNRGFTTYFLNGRQPDIASFDTPKAMGEYVGKVKEISSNSFNVAGTAMFANGDGLCFLNAEHELEGFRVNKAVGNRLFPFKMPEHLKPGIVLYRNNDVAFDKLLSGDTAERKIAIKMFFEAIDGGFSLRIFNDDLNFSATSSIVFEHQIANKPQHDDFDQLLPKFGLNYRFSDDGSNVYATVSKGYRAGGFNMQMFSDVLQTELSASAQSAHGHRVQWICCHR
jgi:Collagenase and related proteases